jgi:hypothetical protein
MIIRLDGRHQFENFRTVCVVYLVSSLPFHIQRVAGNLFFIIHTMPSNCDAQFEHLNSSKEITVGLIRCVGFERGSWVKCCRGGTKPPSLPPSIIATLNM